MAASVARRDNLTYRTELLLLVLGGGLARWVRAFGRFSVLAVAAPPVAAVGVGGWWFFFLFPPPPRLLPV